MGPNWAPCHEKQKSEDGSVAVSDGPYPVTCLHLGVGRKSHHSQAQETDPTRLETHRDEADWMDKAGGVGPRPWTWGQKPRDKGSGGANWVAEEQSGSAGPGVDP